METIKGYVEHIVYRNEDNGYTVFNFVSKEEEITCVGKLESLDAGENLELQGDYTEHALYGRQFKVSASRFVPPEDAVSIERYLGSGAIKGVGQALAARIVKKFGEDTFRIIEEEPERLAEIKGISPHKAIEISVQMEEKSGMREAMLFLQRYGISNTLAMKIYNTYGMQTYHILQENPYQMAEDIEGVGFRIADEIASRIGIHTDSDYRIRCGLLYVLTQAGAEGHLYLPKDLLMLRAAELLGLSIENMEPQLMNLVMDRKLVLKQPAEEKQPLVYGMQAYYAELTCAKLLVDLQAAVFSEGEGSQQDQGYIYKKLEILEKSLEIQLDELQKQAVLTSVGNGVFLLTGGPGTGKTTTINAIIRYFEAEQMDILLAAPTGRAAKRMTEATGYEARTIHRLLELNGASIDSEKRGGFERNEENPLEADVIIVDEMSMVDIYLFQSLLKAVLPGTRLILVGDRNQLPSVGPGQVLRDLLRSGAFPVVRLQKIFRQAEKSDIVVNAHRIQRGEMIPLDNKSRDFFFLERNDVNVIYKHMIQLIREKLPPYVQASSYDIQVLTPMRKGLLGVETLNRILQTYLNPASPKKAEHISGDTTFRVGDKVMQVKNNYQLEWEIVSRYQIPIDKGTGIFNGDLGIVREINDPAQQMVVEFDDHRRVYYPFSQLEELELAYAVTIHKSQGSEYPAVIMPLLSGPRLLLNRNLLYTGITRAKSCVTILGSRQVVQDMIANENENKRYTSLDSRIREVERRE